MKKEILRKDFIGFLIMTLLQFCILRNANAQCNPAVTIQSSNNTFCNTSSSVLTANSNSGNTLQWYFNSSPLGGATSSSYTASQIGDYYCMATSPSCGAANSTVIHFYGNNPPVPVITPSGDYTGTIDNCNGYPITITSNPYSDSQDFNPYEWYRDGQRLFSPLFEYSLPWLNVDSPGTYYCNVIYSCGVAQTNSVNVTVLPASSNPVDAPNGAYRCQSDGNALLQVDYFWKSFQWQKNDTDIAGAMFNSYYAPSSGWYRCKVSNSCASAYTDSILVDIIPNVITASGPTSYCYGDYNSLALSGPSPPAGSGHIYQYSWYNYSGYISNAQSITVPDYVPSIYTYTLHTYPSFGCLNSDDQSTSVNVAVLGTVPRITISGSLNICQGDSVTLSAQFGTLYGYQWKKDGIVIPGSTSDSIVIKIAGNYSVLLTNEVNCTIESSAKTVTVVSGTTASIAASGPVTFCTGGSVMLNANAGGLTYQWQLNGDTISGATSSSYAANAGGDYVCIITYSCGSVTSNTITVSVNALPTVTASSNSPVCTGSTLNLSSGGGLTYSWAGPDGFSSGQQNPSLANVMSVNAGTYAVTAFDANGCSASATTSVSIVSSITYYQDADDDGFGNPAVTKMACSPPSGYVTDSTDCNDNDPTVHAPQIYYVDADHDGYGSTVSASICASTPPVGYSTNNTDCNDSNAAVHPGAMEVCNGIDDNCNGEIDEGCCPPYERFTSNIKRTSAQLNWTSYPSAFGYKIQYRRIGAKGWLSKTIDGGNVRLYNLKGLRRATSYEWEVSTQCTGGKMATYSSFSSPIIFNTPIFRIGEESASDDESYETLSIFPNPTDHSASVIFSSQQAGNYVLEVVDMTGRIIINKKGTVTEGENTVSIDLSNYATGIYFVNLNNEAEDIRRGRLVKQ